ncbi:DUF2147 domain-containing protein [Patiriisocius hiemis]|uniref:DUF2147 domain-containing protein n=1 Tax=Patiriisocius hiemis TaxID=3075604 RepID=A0ABU2Y9S1_9FLAO|nr:DUF2147 domain-containing protein [Constantimarinum sp. W242]MDT0554477.1 DUF2147 domain-containing protein [Constantimarinum sp. W242]
MRKVIFTLALIFTASLTVSAQDVMGKWKTIDDETGEAKSIVEIYQRDGKVYGKVVEILNKDRQDAKCEDCEGEDKDKPVLGLEIIKGLEKDDDEYNGGKILDPQNGKLYKCYITLEEDDKLKVRGYIGFSLIGRTQYWYRVK